MGHGLETDKTAEQLQMAAVVQAGENGVIYTVGGLGWSRNIIQERHQKAYLTFKILGFSWLDDGIIQRDMEQEEMLDSGEKCASS